ncbi:MAG: hypothetical protein QOE98_1100 [Gaiellaceae bacterium]|nr:hypothetical protein [Gaiellaceae bacterium]
MLRTRRLTVLTVGILAALPAAASAAVTCPVQPAPLAAWAGSPKALTLALPCTSTTGTVVYTHVTAPQYGTVTVPTAAGAFTFTGTFNPNGSDPTGPDSVTFSATDSDPTPANVIVPISIGPAPVVSTIFKAADLQPDQPLQDGRPTFDVFYKVPVTATSTLVDPAPEPDAPLAGFKIRFHSGLGALVQTPTNAAGKAVTNFTPLVSDEYSFNVPALPGTFFEGYVLWVAPDWKIASRFPVKNKKFVIAGRLLAKKSARTKGSYVRFQRRKGSKWVTVVSKVPVSSAMTFSVKVSRAAYLNKKVRFLYVSKNVDYIGSNYSFTIRAAKPKSHHARSTGMAAGPSAATRSMHR